MVLAWLLLASLSAAAAEDAGAIAKRLKKNFDAVRAIDTHSHLRSFRHFQETADPQRGFTLRHLWTNSYLTWVVAIPAWQASAPFGAWWADAQTTFDDVRAMSFYRYMLPAFRDLYGVHFESLSADQARRLNDRVVANYRNEKWVAEAIVHRANIELVLVDDHGRLQWDAHYPFTVPVLNVNGLVRGTHPEQYAKSLAEGKGDSPYVFAREHGLAIRNLDDYLNVIDAIFKAAVAKGAVCLKTTLAYQRSIRFEDVPRVRAEKAFGKRPAELGAAEKRDFEDFIIWHVTRLAARYDLPFQIHTGDARLQDSNPMLLLDMIQANPKTKFVLFHGGYPWVGETGAIAMKCRNVWIDSVWLPQISFTMARRAFQEWLDVMPASRIMWGSDVQIPDGVYGAADFTRACLAEGLAEKVARGELREEDAERIGRQILRENALRLLPKLQARVKDKVGKGPR
jgi:hypothetical protein